MYFINKKVIDAYLERELNKWDWVKDLSCSELEQFFKDFYPTFKPKFKPYKHQYASLLAALHNDGFLFLLDMGTGKSKISLDLLQLLHIDKKIKRTLIVCERNIHISEWENQIKLHSDFSYTLLDGSKEDKNKAFLEDTEIHVINYAGLLTMASTVYGLVWEKNKKYKTGDKITCHGKCFTAVNSGISGAVFPLKENSVIPEGFKDGTVFWKINKQKKGTKFEKKLNPEFLDMLSSKYDSFIFDESHNLANKTSKIFKICEKITKDKKYCYALTGTPFEKNLLMTWSQFYLVDKGETFGTEKMIMASAFYNMSPSKFGGVTYTLRKEMLPKFKELMNNKSIVYTENEVAAHLPNKVYINKDLRLNSEGIKAYNKIVYELSKTHSAEKTKIINKFIKLRQVCSGFIKLDDDCTIFKNNPKVDSLLNILQEMPENKKIVVYVHFHESGDILEKVFLKEKISYVRIYGETKDKEAEKIKFLKNPKTKVLLASISSCNSGINLQNVCNYICYYENHDRYIFRRQSEKRIHRDGQIHTCYYIDLIVKGSIEERLLSLLQEGKDLYASTIDIKNKITEIY